MNTWWGAVESRRRRSWEGITGGQFHQALHSDVYISNVSGMVVGNVEAAEGIPYGRCRRVLADETGKVVGDDVRYETGGVRVPD